MFVSFNMLAQKRYEPAKGNLDLTTLRRTASVVWKRSNVNDFSHLDTAAVYATDS